MLNIQINERSDLSSIAILQAQSYVNYTVYKAFSNLLIGR
jgi:hypothetical protein